MQTDILGTLMTGLNRIDQAITLFDSDLTLIFANDRFLELMQMPERFGQPGARFEDLVRWNAERGEYGAGALATLVAARVAAALRGGGPDLADLGVLEHDDAVERRAHVGLVERRLGLVPCGQRGERLAASGGGVVDGGDGA